MEFMCLEVVNSDRVDWRSAKIHRDMLDDEHWLRGLFEKYGYRLEYPVVPEFVAALKSLRADMRLIITSLHGCSQPQATALSRLNKTLLMVSSRKQLACNGEGFAYKHLYEPQGWKLLVWHVARSFAGLLVEHELQRIKICDNDDCGWAFYDGSRNRTRRWCDDKVCGNIMKVRRFRSRQKALD